MLDVFHTPLPSTGYFFEFYGGGSTRTWQKPRGISWVRMMLIGGGGGGGNGGTDSVTGGGGGSSSNYTTWFGPAAVVPDSLLLNIGLGGALQTNGTATTVVLERAISAGYTLLTASPGLAGGIGTAGTAPTVNSTTPFGNSGTFLSVAGAPGSLTAVPASGTTFLSGGAGGGAASVPGTAVTANYGYTVSAGAANRPGNGGFFTLTPVMVGLGGSGGGGGTTTGFAGGQGGLGCGGGGGGAASTVGGDGGRGGDGAVFIWCW